MRRVALLSLLLLGSSCLGEEDLGPGPGEDDCDPNQPYLDRELVVRDVDGDGYGEGPVTSMCVPSGVVPYGWVSAGGPTDCAPDDAFRWWPQPFAARDADGDGFLVAETGEVCSGADLPTGYFATPPAGLLDCDDADPAAWEEMVLFEDRDQDGLGAGEASVVCVGVDAPFGQSPVDGDCAPEDGSAWQLLDYAYRDADGDGYTVDEIGQVCSGFDLPLGYRTYPGYLDCDDQSSDRYSTWVVFRDIDGDGVGAGAAETLCAGSNLPPEYAWGGGDCASTDSTRWRQLSYAFRDADLDTYTVAETGSVCSGAALPAGYLTRAGTGLDCRDSDPLVFLSLSGYVDVDGDGRGAGEPQTYCTAGRLPPGAVATAGDCAPEDAALHTALVSFEDVDGDGIGAGDAATLCTGGNRPPGFVAAGGDCAPADGAAWRVLAYGFVDRDGDGRTSAEAGSLCGGAALPPPYRAEASGNDCDDTDPALLAWAVLYEDGDGDGVGAGPRAVLCTGASLPVELSIHGDDADDGDPLIQTDEEDEEELALLLIQS